MAPPVPTFPAHDLQSAVQATYDQNFTPDSRRRKDKVELRKCELLEMLQYECGVARIGGEESELRVVCRPVERLFRRCQDRKGSFMVETTAWEGLQDGKS